jgi:formylglycine-generating enzyme required for sulfatase activity
MKKLFVSILFVVVLATGCAYHFDQSEKYQLDQTQKTPKNRIINSIGMEFVLIPDGSFTMGSSKGVEIEKPLHKVNILQPFYLQTTKVTQKQWVQIMGDNPSLLRFFLKCGDDCPIENVSWYDVKEFINKLNEIEKTDSYRLPTEAEWEYACLAGRSTEYSAEEDAGKHNELHWCGCDKVSVSKNEYVERSPNSWGLYEMRGARIDEWIEDDYHPNYVGAPDNNKAWVDSPRNSKRVIRGNMNGHDCRWFVRGGIDAEKRWDGIGFRVAKSLTPIR